MAKKKKLDPNEPQLNPKHKYDKRSWMPISRTTAMFRRDYPSDPINRQARVTLAKRTISGLVSKGVRTNLDKASKFTVNKIAKSPPHPQSGAAYGQLRKRAMKKGK